MYETIFEMKEKLKKFERSRNFQIWHDASVIANHGHILFCINILFDPAVFYTQVEYMHKTGEDVDIQSLVETPELYIVGRCKSNDEQLAYIQTRVECLQELKNDLDLKSITGVHEGIFLKDNVRLFHGDGPAVAFEAGNQKGGKYFCPCCDVHICLSDDIAHCYREKNKTFKSIREKVIQGKFGKINSIRKDTCPFSKLTKDQMRSELISRKVDIRQLKNTKKDLEPVLKKTLKGVKRVPVVLFYNPLVDFDTICLTKYELCMVECMHDISGHIENIIEELPSHCSLEDQQIITSFIDVYNEEKDKKRCCDRRLFLLQLTKGIYQKVNGKIFKMLKTLSEVQRILYLGDDYRTPKQILRLHNSCFEHFTLVKEIFKSGTKLMREKLYGKYKHNLLVHAPMQYRLVSGESINCEGEERFFNTIKNITKNTTYYHPGHMIGNLIVRQHIEA